MKKTVKITFCFIIFLFILTVFSCGVNSENKKVATITAVNGAITVNHENSQEWVNGTEKMDVYLNDTLQTGAGSYASIEFLSGGLVNINENTAIQITGTQEATDVTNYSFIQKVIITSGEIWAKITKQQEEIQFQTNGGVVAIKGTEFVITTNEEETNVSLLDGNISFIDKFNNETILYPGDKLSALLDQIPVLTNIPVDQLRLDLEGQFPNLNNIMNQVLNNVPNVPNIPDVPVTPVPTPYVPNYTPGW